MIVNSYKMTGDELKRIYKLSGLKSIDFAAKIGLEKHQLYTQFSRMSKAVDPSVEIAVKKAPDFSKLQLNLSVSTPKEEKIIQGPSQELWEQSFAMLNETVRLVSEDNKFIKDLANVIKEDAALFRSIIQQGMDQGAIKFALPTKK